MMSADEAHYSQDNKDNNDHNQKKKQYKNWGICFWNSISLWSLTLPLAVLLLRQTGILQ